jgi:hypothetical protein
VLVPAVGEAGGDGVVEDGSEREGGCLEVGLDGFFGYVVEVINEESGVDEEGFVLHVAEEEDGPEEGEEGRTAPEPKLGKKLGATPRAKPRAMCSVACRMGKKRMMLYRNARRVRWRSWRIRVGEGIRPPGCLVGRTCGVV